MIFKIENAAMGRSIQARCFELGGKWLNGSKEIMHCCNGNIRITNMVMSFIQKTSKNYTDSGDDVWKFLGDTYGWIVNTGEMICPDDMRIDIIYFDREELSNCAAKDFRWTTNGDAEDIAYWRPHREERRIVGQTPQMAQVEENTAPGFWEKIEMHEKQIRDLKENVSALEYAITQASIANRSLRAENQELRSKGDVLGRANRVVMDRYKA